ncbi:twitching motility protein PilT [Halobacterium rubrum]|uniref:twitching motility protein PilT n=1 Tax=Halobacterium TaxID=2239 RepID=UPI001F480905|nr:MULTISPECIES: twitching motility protein PilT [Halobacterium]MDH5021202.1 twitching motility protein PilT [Halobacterium rubrum]
MTSDTVPTDPSVLNTTVLSNFAAIDRIGLVAHLAGICTVPVVKHELNAGVQTHPYLQPALDALHDTILVAPFSETVANRDDVVRSHLDPGESQAFALADTHHGRLLTDDGDARTFAKQQDVTVVGSVGLLLTALNAGRITEATANDWLQTWIDDYDYYVPYRTIDE